MQLYKSRGFGDFFQDTFSFLRQNGKHLYKNFFVINGIFILILMVFGYFFTKFYTDVVFGGVLNSNPNAVEDYMNQNSGTVILAGLCFLIIAIISAAISYAFVPIYLKLYSKNRKNFTASDIINEYKLNIGKISKFILFGLLIVIPIAIVAGVVSFILAITLIGILLLPVVIGAVSLLYQSSLMEYFEHKKGIRHAFNYAWELMSSKFWPAVGCVGIFYLMSYIAQNVITLIPYFVFLIDILTNIETGVNPDPQELTKSFSIMMLVIFVLSFLMSSILNVIVQVNQGLIFYSLKEDKEHINVKSDIELIGASE